MWPFSLKNTKHVVSPKTRSVVCIGGGGMFGKAVIEKIPPQVQFGNVSRHRVLMHPSVYNIPLDVLTVSPSKVIEAILSYVSRIDVLVYAPFSSYFKPIESMSETELQNEFSLMALRPLSLANAFRDYAKKYPQEKRRAYIALGSGVYKGLPSSRKDIGSYGASKAYLHQGILALARPFYETQVRTIIIHPGSLHDTPVREKTVNTFWDEALALTLDDHAVVHEIF